MEEYKYKEEYEAMIKEYNNFKKIYEILKLTAKEIQNEMNIDDVISYFCIITNEEKTYITFYKEDGIQLVQVETEKENTNFFELFDSELIKEVDVERPENDDYTYRGFIFNYNEEPYFIKQIMDGIKFENTDLIKEIRDELEYYKDKIITKKNEVFDYTETNNILNQYKFEED